MTESVSTAFVPLADPTSADSLPSQMRRPISRSALPQHDHKQVKYACLQDRFTGRSTLDAVDLKEATGVRKRGARNRLHLEVLIGCITAVTRRLRALVCLRPGNPLAASASYLVVTADLMGSRSTNSRGYHAKVCAGTNHCALA